MQHLETYALANNIKKLQLPVSPIGLNFYYKHSWEKVRDITLFYSGIGFEESLMVKNIR